MSHRVRTDRRAIVGEISIVEGGLHRAGVVYQAQDNPASVVSFIEQRDLARAYREGRGCGSRGPAVDGFDEISVEWERMHGEDED